MKQITNSMVFYSKYTVETQCTERNSSVMAKSHTNTHTHTRYANTNASKHANRNRE